jgi:hypothetical protein
MNSNFYSAQFRSQRVKKPSEFDQVFLGLSDGQIQQTEASTVKKDSCKIDPRTLNVPPSVLYNPPERKRNDLLKDFKFYGDTNKIAHQNARAGGNSRLHPPAMSDAKDRVEDYEEEQKIKALNYRLVNQSVEIFDKPLFS